MSLSLEAFIAEQKRLLQVEHAAELEESRMRLESRSSRDLQTEGVAILRLKIEEVGAFLGDQLLVTFALNSGHKELPPTRLSNGDIVGIFSGNDVAAAPLTTGVVHAVKREKISVVVGENFEENFQVFSLCLVGNDVTHRRLMETLAKLEKIGNSHPLVSLAFGDTEISRQPISEHTLLCPERNESQNAAIARCLARESEISLILGPPGTGKTSTLTSLIKKHLEICRANFRSAHVLVCAPSNAAVDNVGEALLDAGISDIVRLGHPARISERLEAATLAARVESSDEATLCRDIRSEISANRKSQETRALRKELKRRMQSAFERVLSGNSVILATCIGAAQLENFLPQNFQFDFVAVDEAAQTLEVACWLPALIGNCRKFFLAGDHKQLGPTVKSPQAQELQRTLFARLENKFGEEISSMLTTQYRMHEKIMAWSNLRFYGGRLVAAESARSRTLADLIDPNFGASDEDGETLFFLDKREMLEMPVIFIDTAYEDGFAETADEEISRCNPGEAAVVAAYVKFLRSAGVADVGVITPYSRQSEILRNLIDSVQIATVDAFQGREKEAVVISTVRSNAQGIFGFLGDERRMNVAVTRAKRQVVVVGNSQTLGNDENLKSLVEYCESIDALFPVAAFMNISLLQIPRPQAPKAATSHSTKTVPKNEEKKKQKAVSLAQKILDTPLVVVQDKPQISDQQILNPIQDMHPGQSFDFPADLRPDERRRVHELADSLGLAHVSHGEKDARFIRVTRSELPPHPTQQLKEETSKSEAEKETVPVRSPPAKTPTKAAGKTAPNKGKSKILKEDDEDFDKILDAEIAQQGVCGMCGQRPPWTAMPCRFCKRKFCLEHNFAEIHGCGEAARREARAPPRGSVAPSWKKEEMQRKLDESIAGKQKLRLQKN